MFILEAQYNGYSQDFDRKLDRAVKREREGSGCGFGRRDITWSFKKEEAAKRAASRLRRFKGVRARVFSVED